MSKFYIYNYRYLEEICKIKLKNKYKRPESHQKYIIWYNIKKNLNF